MPNFKFEQIVSEELNRKRLDQALTILLPQHSRSRIQDWIEAGFVKVDGKILRSKDKVKTGQQIAIDAIIALTQTEIAQPIELNIVYEDEDIIIINKPPGLVVHPGAGQADSTLLNALLHHDPKLGAVPRAGIIHRLDKDTSGLLVVARNLEAHTNLVAAMQQRKIKREYEAIVNGALTAGGTIEAPIGRHQTKRTQMAVTSRGKPAITHYRIIKRFSAHTHIRVILETGRTHQIRVHLAHIGYPVVGDPAYGSRVKIPANCSHNLRETLQNFKRQALHARKLGLYHPRTGEYMEWEAELPHDMLNLINQLT